MSLNAMTTTNNYASSSFDKLRTEESKGTKEALAIVNANEWVTQCSMTTFS